MADFIVELEAVTTDDDTFVLDVSELDTDRLPATPIWLTVPGVVSASWSRGRSREQDAVRAGQMTVAVDTAGNADWQLLAEHIGAFAGQVATVSRRLRVLWEGPTGRVPMFVGRVQQVVEQPDGALSSFVTLSAEDALATLGRIQLPQVAEEGDGELSGARVNRVLDAAGWPEDLRTISDGLSPLDGYFGGVNAASYLQEVAQSEGGLLYADASGGVTFLSRDEVDNDGNARTTLVDLWVDGVASGEDFVEFESLSAQVDSQYLFNDVTVSGSDQTGGSPPSGSYTDLRSVAYYGTRSLERASLSNDATTVQDQADWLGRRFAFPAIRFPNVQVHAGVLPDVSIPAVLELEPGSLVEVRRTPDGPVGEQVCRALVDTVSWQVRSNRRWVASFSTSDPVVMFVLDSGRLGQDRLGW